MYEINICHLYPDLLNLYGDRGNLTAFQKRCEWRGIKTNIYGVSLYESFIPESYDMVFIGGGQDYEQEIIKNDIVYGKGQEIKNAIEDGMIFLCICGGYQLLGRYYRTTEGNTIKSIGALDIWTIAGKKRMTGNMLFKCDFLEYEKSGGMLVGFENHSGRTYLGRSVKPLGKVIAGYGNNGEDGYEGAVYKNTFCSYSHGSLLPKNPCFTDYLIMLVLKRKYKALVSLEVLDDSFEDIARESIVNRLVR